MPAASKVLFGLLNQQRALQSQYERPDGASYAAIWRQVPGGPLHFRHGLSVGEYQQEFDTMIALGFALKHVHGYAVSGREHFSGIWEAVPSPAFFARHNMDAAAYQAEFDNQSAQGFRLMRVSGYERNGAENFVALWEKILGPAMIARHGMTTEQYQEQFDQAVSQGIRLILVNGYGFGGQFRFVAIWVKDGGPPIEAHHNLGATQYQATFDRLVSQGMHLTWVSCYRIDEDELYAAIWERSESPALLARHRMTSVDFQHEFETHGSADGFRPFHITAG